MSKKLLRKIEADPKLSIYSKKTKAAKILSIIGIVFYAALLILIIIAILSFFNYLENDFTLFGL
jgi:amino acid transporter